MLFAIFLGVGAFVLLIAVSLILGIAAFEQRQTRRMALLWQAYGARYVPVYRLLDSIEIPSYIMKKHSPAVAEAELLDALERVEVIAARGPGGEEWSGAVGELRSLLLEMRKGVASSDPENSGVRWAMWVRRANLLKSKLHKIVRRRGRVTK